MTPLETKIRSSTTMELPLSVRSNSLTRDARLSRKWLKSRSMLNFGPLMLRRNKREKCKKQERSKRRLRILWQSSTGRKTQDLFREHRSRSWSRKSSKCSKHNGQLRRRKRSKILSRDSYSTVNVISSWSVTMPLRSSWENKPNKEIDKEISSFWRKLYSRSFHWSNLRLMREWLVEMRFKHFNNITRSSNPNKLSMRGWLITWWLTRATRFGKQENNSGEERTKPRSICWRMCMPIERMMFFWSRKWSKRLNGWRIMRSRRMIMMWIVRIEHLNRSLWMMHLLARLTKLTSLDKLESVIVQCAVIYKRKCLKNVLPNLLNLNTPAALMMRKITIARCLRLGRILLLATEHHLSDK